MSDIFDKELRHKVMSSIRSKNSKAEILTFSYLRKRGVYYQKHYSKAMGTPDIALPRKKIAVFIDGDFWHGRRLEELKAKRGMDDYWTKKILRNIERDSEQREWLMLNGWRVLSVWESDILRKRTRATKLLEIEDFLKS